MRRYYGGARARRRRNPGGGASLARTRSSSGGGIGGARTKNGPIGLGDIFNVMPAATAGVWAARWAVQQAGEFEDGEPGFKHAIAIYLAASFGSDLIGSMFGGNRGAFAAIAALGFGGDLFLRKRFLKDSKWVGENISLQGVDDTATNLYARGATYDGMGADSFTDAVGNRYVQTAQGWALAGDGGSEQLYMDESGQVFQLPAGVSGFEASTPIGGFEASTPIGAIGRRRSASSDSSFGYI
jgi:hypothetical protein